MLRSLMRYGSIAAKVRAMYGKMYKDSDWQRLCGMSGIDEVAAYIRKSPGWAYACGLLPASDTDAAALITAIRGQLRHERDVICKYATREDKRYLDYAVYEEEYKLILQTLRRLSSYRRQHRPIAVSDVTRRQSKLDFTALDAATSYDGILDAVRGTKYEPLLAGAELSPDTGLPNYAEISVKLEHRYYSELYKFLLKLYKGSGKRQLTERVGTQADLQNILHILRLKRHFQSALTDTDSTLIPIRAKLTPELIQELAASRTEEDAVAILRRSRWRGTFAGYDPANLDKLYSDGMLNLSRKLLRNPEPSLCVPQSYLDLKEDEAAKLIRVIEAVRNGVSPQNVI